MAQLFLSYAREDAGDAQQLAEALGNAGHQVWWDRHLHGGSRFADEIDRELAEAEVIVVLWSQHSCGSAWVLDEATEARDSGRLVPASLDSTKPPLGFRQYQTVSLADAVAAGESRALDELLHAIASTASKRAPDGGQKAEAAARPGRQYSICVLPFANMSGDVEQEYFSDGISEDIITDLSRVSALSVVARNTAFTFKGKSVRVPDVARELGVSHVLEGSVRKSGGRVRITAQLIDGAAGDHVWAERYDRDLTDIFAIQDEISSAIVAALKLKLLPAEKKAIEQRGTSSAEAYDLYLMARQYWVSGNYGDTRRDEVILRLCQSALEIDPGYARAWALLALTQADLRYRNRGSPDDGTAAAEKALEYDPTLAEPYCVKARFFAQHGRHEEANAEVATAIALDPDSWEVNKEAAFVTFRQGRIEEAIPYFEKAVALAETDCRSAGMLVTCYRGLGDTDSAERVAKILLDRTERAVAQDKSNGAALGLGAVALAQLGEPERAREWMRRAVLIDPGNTIMRYNLACACAVSLNDVETAIDLIQPYLANANTGQLHHVASDPDLDTLRDHPRFKEMLAEARARVAAEEAG
jgi:adenylate cyclase